MARTVTLSSLRSQVRQRADMENSTFVSDSELNTYINQSIARLYRLVLKASGEDRYTTSTTLNIVAGTDTYALPAGFYKLRAVDWVLSSTDVRALHEFTWEERNKYLLFAGWDYTGDIGYQVRGSNIVFIPVPAGSHTVRVWYVPAPSTLSLDADTFDGVAGWEEFVVVDAAIKCLVKEESDTSVLMQERAILEADILEDAVNTDLGSPKRVQDVSYSQPEF